ncbi:MAG: ribbon-helix-helix domain-containing protein [Alphaproteobacteria bacterium]
MIDDYEIKKHSITLKGHATSITLENIFWRTLQDIARGKGETVSQILNNIDSRRTGNLSSEVRIYVIRHLLKENHNLKNYK